MHILSAKHVLGALIALGLSFMSTKSIAQDANRAGLDCGSGRSIGLEFCYDAAVVEPTLPLGGFAYVLATPDRSGFIMVSLIDGTQGLPGVDTESIDAYSLDPRFLPMGPAYVLKTKIALTDPDAATGSDYNASLSTDGDFGFQVQAVRVGQVPGGTVRLALMTMGQKSDVGALTQAFAQVSGTLTLLP